MALIDKLSAIGDAIREKTGKDDLLTLDEMPAEISAIETGGGELPEEAFIVSGECGFRFAYNNWNWFIEEYGNRITTDKITNANSMFIGSTDLTEIPFSINFFLNGEYSSKTTVLNSAFPASTGTILLKEYPEINITTNSTKGRAILLGKACGVNGEKQNMYFGDNVKIGGFDYQSFQYYQQSVEPTWLFDMCDWDFIRSDTSTFGTTLPMNWSYSLYLKTIPSMPKFYALGTGNYYHHWYQFNINNCHNLQRIVLPRPGPAALTSTPSGLSFSGLPSLKHLTFDMQDNGEPYTANWKNITINLSSTVGYALSLLKGLDANKKVSNEETYSLLKDDEDWWGGSYRHSCYNHDSAVETINSLPDTSAYGTNTIKFKQLMGEITDAGAVDTLTEEEIAVATAKGWTVSFV